MNGPRAWGERMSKPENLVILGSGPAGLTAAIYAARANLAPLLYEGEEPGGQLTTTTDVENYPAFPQGVQGPEMMRLMREQAERFETRFRTVNISKVDLSQRPFRLWEEGGKEPVQTKSLVICTGASAKYLGLANEKRLLGRGVSSCATCDGAFFKNQKVCVVGGGDTAMEEALFLTRFASEVVLVHRRGEFRASKIMSDRVKQSSKIKILWHTQVVDVLGEKEVEAVCVKNSDKNEDHTLKVQGVFIAIGHSPNTAIFKDQLKANAQGYLITQPKSTHTSVEGVFAAGDVQDPTYRQAITAAGSGCMAAMDAERWLESHSCAPVG